MIANLFAYTSQDTGCSSYQKSSTVQGLHTTCCPEGCHCNLWKEQLDFVRFKILVGVWKTSVCSESDAEKTHSSAEDKMLGLVWSYPGVYAHKLRIALAARLCGERSWQC